VAKSKAARSNDEIEEVVFLRKLDIQKILINMKSKNKQIYRRLF